MFPDEENNDDQNHPESTKKPRKVYGKPALTSFNALDVETGRMHVPENNNGLLDS